MELTGTKDKGYTKMIENTVQEFKGNTREQSLYDEVLRLQEVVDTLTAQREMLQRELFKVQDGKPNIGQ